MDTTDRLWKLIAMSVMLFIAFTLAIVSLATGGWSSAIQVPLLTLYIIDHSLLWVVGCVVLIILGILCICISAVVLMARFFNHGKGRAILGGILSIFAGITFIVSLIIFMVQQKPNLVTYGYSFILLWIAVPFAIAPGVIFVTLEDSDFLK